MTRRSFFGTVLGGLLASTLLPLVGRRYTPTLDWLRAQWHKETKGKSSRQLPWGLAVSPGDFHRIEHEFVPVQRFAAAYNHTQECWLTFKGIPLRPNANLNDGVVMFIYKTSSPGGDYIIPVAHAGDGYLVRWGRS